MEPQIKIGDEVRLVRPTDRTIERYPSLKIGMEGTFVRKTSDYNGITNKEPQFYCIDWGRPITNGSNTGLCVQCNEKGDQQGDQRCKLGQGSYIEPDEIMVI